MRGFGESVLEEQRAVKEEKEAALFIIRQFEKSQNPQLKKIIQGQAETLLRCLEQLAFWEGQSGLKKAARKIKILLLKKRIMGVVESLRTIFEALLEREHKEERNKKSVPALTKIYEESYKALRFLTLFWPANSAYQSEIQEGENHCGLPTCPICLEGIRAQDRLITSYHYQFHTICLVGCLSRKLGINPMTNLSFSFRDQAVIKETAKQIGFTVHEPIQDIRNQVAGFRRSLLFIGASFVIWTLGAILGAVGVGAALVATIYLLGYLGLIGGFAYLLYRARRDEQLSQLNEEDRWNLYREELELTQALALSLQEYEQKDELQLTASCRNVAMDFLYTKSKNTQAGASLELAPLSEQKDQEEAKQTPRPGFFVAVQQSQPGLKPLTTKADGFAPAGATFS